MHELHFQDLAPEVLALLRQHNMLRSLVRAETVAKAVGPVKLKQKQCDQLWDAYLEKHKIENDEQLKSHLDSAGFDSDALHWQLELPARIQQHSREQFQHKAEARFLANKEKLDKVVYSLLRVRDDFMARELYLRIAGNEAKFADLAAEFSQGPEAKTKGVVGPVPLNQAHPALSERLRTSQPGQLLEPFRIDDWILVARLESYDPARFDESTAQRMAQELFQEWIQENVLCKLLEISSMDGLATA